MLAGPNGAGKSTVYRTLSLSGTFVNADDMARELDPTNPEGASIAAGRLVLDRLHSLISGRQDFIYETTLSSHQSIKLLKQAREAGYSTLLVFVALASAELHILRVAQRVSLGGHHIPEEAIRRRYLTSFENLSRAIPLCHHVVIFDNSSAEGVRRVLDITEGAVAANDLKPGNGFDARIADIVAPALEISASELFRPRR